MRKKVATSIRLSEKGRRRLAQLATHLETTQAEVIERSLREMMNKEGLILHEHEVVSEKEAQNNE